MRIHKNINIVLEILKNFLINEQEDLNKIYKDAIIYTRNKNKYGLYDFNDYNKVITTIFNIK